MKKLLVTLFTLVGLSVSGLAFAGLADGAGILGSPHDFSDNECWNGDYTTPGDASTPKAYVACDETTGAGLWNDSGELCRVCHIPHDHGRTAPYMSTGLLWNRDLSTVATWTPYDSGSLELPATSPDGLSLACLGCHDGLTSISAFDLHSAGNGGGDTLGPNVIGSSGAYAAAAFNAIRFGDGTATGNDITSNHPISVVYDSSLGTGMNDETVTAFDTGRVIVDRLDAAGKVQCSSCHDVHNNSVANEYLLRLPVKDGGGGGSQLCLACHNK